MASKEAGIEVVNIYDKYSDKDRNQIDKLTDYRIETYRDFLSYLSVSNHGFSKKLVKDDANV